MLGAAVLAVFAGCGGGGAGGGTAVPPVDPPPGPLPQYTLTPNHRWGLLNGGVPSIDGIQVNEFDPPNFYVMTVRPVNFGAGVLWEASEAESLPPGRYILTYSIPGLPYSTTKDFDFLPGVRDALIIRYQ